MLKKVTGLYPHFSNILLSEFFNTTHIGKQNPTFFDHKKPLLRIYKNIYVILRKFGTKKNEGKQIFLVLESSISDTQMKKNVSEDEWMKVMYTLIKGIHRNDGLKWGSREKC